MAGDDAAAEEARRAMDAARTEVMDRENEIQKIKASLRSIGQAGGVGGGGEKPNVLRVSALKVSGLPDSAKPSFKLQLSSPAEELEITRLWDPLNADAGGSVAKFEGVDPSAATLTVAARDADVPLGTSASHDAAPLCEFDPLGGRGKGVSELEVAIVPDGGGAASSSSSAAAAAEKVEAKEEAKAGEPKAGVADAESPADASKAEGEKGAKKAETPRPAVFCGPSGVGKGTLIDMLMKRFPGDQFGFSVSHTTRPPREGEKDGVHYHFTSVQEIERDIAEGKFIEHAEVHGKYYGTSVAAVEAVRGAGRICVLDIDVQGVRSVKKSSLDPIYVFVAPPSVEELEKRLRGRKTESEEDIAKRLANAKGELDYGLEEGNFDRVFTNDDLDKTFAELVDAFKGWYPHLVEKAEGEPPKETKEGEKEAEPEAGAKEGGEGVEEAESKAAPASAEAPAPAVQTPTCTVTLRAEFEPSAKDRRERLYVLLNDASRRKTAAINKLRRSAAEVSRSSKPSASPTKTSEKPDEKAVKPGFLNKKGKEGKKGGFLRRWYERTVGPNSLLRAVFPVAKNYVLFFGAVVLMHFKGHELALPPPV